MKTKLCSLRIIVLITIIGINVFNCYSSTPEEIPLTIVHDDSGSFENDAFRSISYPFYACIQDNELNVLNSIPYYNISLKIVNNFTGEEVCCLKNIAPEYSSNITISLGNLNVGTYTLIIRNYDKGYYCYGTFNI